MPTLLLAEHDNASLKDATSDESSYVNGQAFPVDGGLSSTLPFTKPIR
jgi:hypothetical protein